jgi:hypothetical protein
MPHVGAYRTSNFRSNEMKLEDIKSIFTRVQEEDPTVTWEQAMPVLINWIRSNGRNGRFLSNPEKEGVSERLIFAEEILMEVARGLDQPTQPVPAMRTEQQEVLAMFKGGDK